MESSLGAAALQGEVPDLMTWLSEDLVCPGKAPPLTSGLGS